jgi:SAM-dependent methyltransferase
VLDIDWIVEHGFIWPDDIQFVNDEILLNLLLGRPVPHSWSLKDWVNPARDSSVKMREIAVFRLSGTGIEIGAASSPFPIPLNCHVRYGDRLDKNALNNSLYAGQEIFNLIEPDLTTDLETLEGSEDNTLDFIVDCHVIEHTRNPIAALENSYNKLRTGGYLVLVVPDKERTFDKKRELTKLEHLISDYEHPSQERDKQHYVEFFHVVREVPDEELDYTVDVKFKEQDDIHYHTFTYESFTLLIDYVRKHICSWSSVWSQPTLAHPVEDIEFYFVLTK